MDIPARSEKEGYDANFQTRRSAFDLCQPLGTLWALLESGRSSAVQQLRLGSATR